MNLIDHRILIPTSPERVWQFVGDLRRNTEWQVNAQTLSLLTSNPKPAPGMRFRLTQQRGRDQVWEITAWYDRFGYEYQVVEGGAFRENKGQLRLQETPEGTVVQWTFSYRGGGLFGNAGKAQEQLIINSLKMLYKVITRSKEVETFQAKSLMRDDPGVEARANYRPRHSTSVPTESGQGVRVPKSPYGPPTPNKPMPPVPDELAAPRVSFTRPPDPAERTLYDTRPHPATPEPVARQADPEPDFLAALPPIDAPAPVIAPSQPVWMKPADPTPTPPRTPPVELPPVIELAPAAPPVVEATPAPEPVTPPAVEVKPVAEAAPTPPPVVEIKRVTSEIPASAPVIESPEPKPEPRPRITDTSQISVFELFGLPKPSKTQPMPALSPEMLSSTGQITPITDAAPAPEAPAPAEAEAPAAAPSLREVGLRAEARRTTRRARQRFR
jgi:hypothetical protein